MQSTLRNWAESYLEVDKKEMEKKTVGEKVEWYDNHVTINRKDAITLFLFNVSFC